MTKANKVIDEIYIKYDKYIEQAKSDYVNGLDYASLMEILRYCESRLGKQIPTNLTCSPCVIELLKLFGNLK